MVFDTLVIGYYAVLVVFIRKVKTSSGSTAVQIARRENKRDRVISHIGSANTEDELNILLQLAHKQMLGGQLSLFPDDKSPRIIQIESRPKYLWDTLCETYHHLGLDAIDDPLFKHLVVARLIEPTSKLGSIRIIAESGTQPPTYTAIHRCLQRINSDNYRDVLQQVFFKCTKLHNLSLVLYDVTTLYFESQQGDEFRKPGLSKERRLEPQILVGLLVTRTGFPLAISEFEGNKAEAKTIIPIVQEYVSTHGLGNVTIATDAGMLSSENLTKLEEAGFTYIVGSKMDKIPYCLELLGELEVTPSDSFIFDTDKTFMLAGRKQKRRIIYQYKEKRAKLDIKNIDDQIEKAKKIIDGKTQAKKNKFLKITTKDKTLNTDLINKYKARAGWKGYITNLPRTGKQKVDPLEIISNYHQLFQVEKSFRMSKSDLKARPIFHHKLESIRAHITIVFAALAMARFIEDKTGISIRKFIQLLHTIQSGTVEISGKSYDTEPKIPNEVLEVIRLLTH